MGEIGDRLGEANPMPESVTDRPANSHEKIFLVTKSSRYFYDAEAVRETAKTDWRTRTDGFRSKNVYTVFTMPNPPMFG